VRGRLLELLTGPRRRFLLRVLCLAAGLLCSQLHIGQLLFGSGDLGDELQCRGVPAGGQSCLEVDGGGRGLGPGPLVDGFGFFPPGHGLAVGVVQEAVSVPFGILQDPGDVGVDGAARLRCVVVGALTRRASALVSQRMVICGVGLSPCPHLGCFLVRQRQDGADAFAQTSVGGHRGLHLCLFQGTELLDMTFDLALELASCGLELADLDGPLGGLLLGCRGCL